MNNLELNNTEIFEDSGDKFSNIVGEKYSNANTDAYMKAGRETLSAATQLAAMVAANKQAKLTAMANTGCTPPPLIDWKGKKKTAYQRCLAIAKQDAEAKEAAANALAKEQMASNERMALAGVGAGAGGAGAGKTFLGMPQTVGIIVTIVGSIALIVGGILIVKKMSKK